MSRGINKVILIGNLGRDPETRSTSNGSMIANVTVATSEQWKDRNTGEQRESTEWHRVVFFGRLAEIVDQYLRKGSQVYVEGRLQTRKWQDKDGQDRWSTEIVASEMQMLGSSGGSDRSTGSGGRDTGDWGRAPARKTGTSNTGWVPGAEDPDDDIPF